MKNLSVAPLKYGYNPEYISTALLIYDYYPELILKNTKIMKIIIFIL